MGTQKYEINFSQRANVKDNSTSIFTVLLLCKNVWEHIGISLGKTIWEKLPRIVPPDIDFDGKSLGKVGKSWEKLISHRVIRCIFFWEKLIICISLPKYCKRPIIICKWTVVT